jgi:hypothetical protein
MTIVDLEGTFLGPECSRLTSRHFRSYLAALDNSMRTLLVRGPMTASFNFLGMRT